MWSGRRSVNYIRYTLSPTNTTTTTTTPTPSVLLLPRLLLLFHKSCHASVRRSSLTRGYGGRKQRSPLRHLRFHILRSVFIWCGCTIIFFLVRRVSGLGWIGHENTTLGIIVVVCGVVEMVVEVEKVLGAGITF